MSITSSAVHLTQRDSCIAGVLSTAAERTPADIAIAAPGRAPLAYDRLRRFTHHTRDVLNAMGIRRNDRVAVVIPNGPELAAAFVAVAASAACAPLNPAYRAPEFEFYLSDLGAKALIVQAGIDSPAAAVARQRGIAIIELEPTRAAEAGVFTLSGGPRHHVPDGAFAQPDDTALVLYTSGTTARPKQVALTHENICASAHSIAATLRLDRRDRCLNVMPLYHIHGLIGATLSTLTASASIACPPGFDEAAFFAWLDEFRPSWYTAVPTIHQAILARAAECASVVARCPLRFIRSCSAALPPQVMTELERVFGVPVLEAYGMTEASHQISSNPLPPLPRKTGSVGTATGCDAAIMDEAGVLLPPGAIGEIVIRGPGVTRGYANDAEATSKAFVNGWFRTGDQGLLDADGYLFIRGRLKEIINRGGMKISPREVEEVLLDHPDVVQAVAFGVPHRALGENVAAAVVMRKDAAATEVDLRQFAATRLADFRVPSRILLVDVLPVGATGKLQRAQMADRFASALSAPFAGPGDALELDLVRVWKTVLGVEQVGVHDNFFDLGGTSLSAVRMLEELHEISGRTLPVTVLYQAQTIRQLGEALKDAAGLTSTRVTAISPEGANPPFFFLHGDYTGGGFYSLNLAKRLGPQQPFYALHPHGLDGGPVPSTIEAMAADYLATVRAIRPRGPYLLGGHCNAGLIAFEVAGRLRAEGERVDFLALVDAPAPNMRLSARILHRLVGAFAARRGMTVEERLDLYVRLRRRLLRQGDPPADTNPDPRRRNLTQLYRRAIVGYLPRRYAGKVTLLLSEDEEYRALPARWRALASEVEVHAIPGTHLSSITQHVGVFAERMGICLRNAQRPPDQTPGGEPDPA
ncbi:MAG TPA: AMP-binding protein [bacterium]|nr:AMP-binding protein [bacterium]